MGNKVDQSGFQLDKKELLKDVPFALKPLAGGLIDALNSVDSNHDGKADICQLAPFVIQALPVIAAILPLLHPEKLVQWFVNHDFVTNKLETQNKLLELINIATDASKQCGKPSSK